MSDLSSSSFSPVEPDGTPLFELRHSWAKTNSSGLPALSVSDHCINVGAVAKCLVELLSSRLTGQLPGGAATFVAAHDIGKISPGFLLKSPAWREQWQAALGLDLSLGYETFHAKVSQHYLGKQFSKSPYWLISVGGHHGSYCSAEPKLWRVPNEGPDDSFDVLKNQLLEELVSIFGPLSAEKVRRSPRLHFFTGFMIFSDWIGSSERWFPLDSYEPGTPCLRVETATARAERAIEEIGWGKRSAKGGMSFGELFAEGGTPSFEPHPLQSCLIDAVDAPGLYILEAPMGGGKTEAALAAAYRRWSEGDERGLYFALPTQLTSNRIHERIKQFLANVVAGVSPLSIVHGSAWLSPDRMTSVQPSTPESVEDASEANRWFTDNRKAMLAPFGTGTIDQALMAAMPVKFSALRLFALGGKVVVIDEVHSYDPYTSALVDRAVKYFLEVGCTVIVLSATLTKKRRASLVEKAAGAREENVSDAYPLLTKVVTGSVKADSIPVRGAEVEPLKVAIESESAESRSWLERACEAAEAGACVLIVRNTVALAQETFRLAKSQCRGDSIEFGLLHSRFPQYRRNENESDWMEKLGKGNGCRPKGCILVGTQVLEQSVDIDSDLLITDLAPSELLLQRMGRLHRHHRERPTGFETPRCIILEPTVDWTAGEKEIKSAIGPSAYVYAPYTLFQAQRVWKGLRAVSLPGDIRGILEESDRLPEALPAGADEARRSYEAETRKKINTAFSRDLFELPLSDVEGMETRWNPTPTAHVVLLRSRPRIQGRKPTLEFLNGSTVTVPEFGFSFDLARELHLNAVRVPRYLLVDVLKQDAAPGWLKAHMSGAVLAVRSVDAMDCEILDAPELCAYGFSYDAQRGLWYEKNDGVRPEYDEPEEDSWY